MITADTNVFVYLHDDDAPAKQAVAQAVVRALARRRAAIALQVIGELQNVLRRKLRQPPWLAAQNARNVLVAFDTFHATESAAAEALAQMAAGRFSYWDALLLVSSRDAGCSTFLTEDLDDGARFGPVEIVNPFAQSGLSERAAVLLGA